MYIPTPNRLAILRYLFNEGVLLAKKDFYAKDNIVLPEIPNIHVIKLMQSFTTRKFVTETFNWQSYYWCLTPEGVTYLREYLHLDETVVPQTMRVTKQTASGEGERYERRGGRNFGERDGYRRDGYKKDGENFRPNFRGGDDRFRREGDAPRQ
ncbi:putative 40S ribosomal protein S10 [Blattamonas nauphoetae]|uniref:40S ribosomal protein S10 n=1 Tax=Blattamonas nauphoetae TaxID=2049346 RepID=A0ABQ9XA51_9EUKA|nr:putative 40S ribosomal protein S10 [Blattamonas nauphoetae]KAK2949416.1 putative 40S ribosomal protein S10 [Blattamonas nauphoetae]